MKKTISLFLGFFFLYPVFSVSAHDFKNISLLYPHFEDQDIRKKQEFYDPPDLSRIALHEEGHALTNIPEKTYSTLELLSIVPNGEEGGRVSLRANTDLNKYLQTNYESFSKGGKEFLLFITAQGLAGGLADYYSGSQGDFLRIESFMSKQFLKKESLYFKLKAQIARKIFNIEIKPPFSEEAERFHEKASQAFLKGAQKLSLRLLDLNWDKIQSLAQEALEKKDLTRQDLKKYMPLNQPSKEFVDDIIKTIDKVVDEEKRKLLQTKKEKKVLSCKEVF